MRTQKVTVRKSVALCPSWKIVVVHGRCVVASIVIFCKSLKRLWFLRNLTNLCIASSKLADTIRRTEWRLPAVSLLLALESESGKRGLDRQPSPGTERLKMGEAMSPVCPEF